MKRERESSSIVEQKAYENVKQIIAVSAISFVSLSIYGLLSVFC